MPITSLNQVIPFVNGLEEDIIQMNQSLEIWEENRRMILREIQRVPGAASTATTALVRADEALSEIGTATFTSSATRGNRLKDILDEIRNEIYEYAGAGGPGGTGAATEGLIYDEVTQAISSVDATINEGLKLDFRFQNLEEMIQDGGTVGDQKLYMPYKHEVHEPVLEMTYIIPAEEGLIYTDAVVTVLDHNLEPVFVEGKMIEATIDETGLVSFNEAPRRTVKLYFPVEASLSNIPPDFLYIFMEQLVTKNNNLFQRLEEINAEIERVENQVVGMRGEGWYEDITLMKNHQDIVREQITPKGLVLDVQGDQVHARFSYQDHENLSHFVMEEWDEETKSFVPVNENGGIIQKS